ncbi:hypothetical protein [Streptomyces sp. CS62]|uniref:hypothetical protein n=1 Tax=Streptomyces sp. CS62 TaxID=3119268 RepID=UPI003FA6CEF2
MSTGIQIRPVRAEDFAQWRVLYRGYADFYEVDQSEEMAATVWSWLNDPGHEVSGLVGRGGRRPAGRPRPLPPLRPPPVRHDGLLPGRPLRRPGKPRLGSRGPPPHGPARPGGGTRLERRPLDHRRRQPPRPRQVRPGRHPHDVGHLRHADLLTKRSA